MAISQRELFEIAQTHLEEPSNLLHFKAGFAKGEHQLIMVFSECEKVVNTGWGCQEENAKKLNDLMGLTAPERGYQTEVYSSGDFWHWKVRNAHGAVVSVSQINYHREVDAQAVADAEVEGLIAMANQLKVAK
ncbi:hypothetical protein VPHK449_0022 [Vibrio phage K449]